jgi:phage terminase large subunit
MASTVRIPEAYKFFFEPSGIYRYRAAYGGRGSGKSHQAATALVMAMANRPITVLCCREVQRSIKDSVKRLIDNKITDLGLEKRFESTLTEVRSSTGGRFIFEGLRANVDNIKSLEGVDICWVEEAQSISQTSIDTLVPTIRKPNSEMWFTWNPRFKNDPVDTLFRSPAGTPPKTALHEVNFDKNPFFPEVLREEMEWDRKRNPDKFAHVWMGEYLTHSEARVFRNWTVEPFETPSDVDRFYFGADWGFSVDPTALIRCFIKGRKLFVDFEAYKVGCPIEQTPSLFRTVPEAMRWTIIADSARPETNAYMRDHGFKVISAKKGEGSVEDGIEFLKNYDIVVHPRCKHMADELSLFSYRIDKQTNEILPVVEDANNHCTDALRYAVETLRRTMQAKILSPVIVSIPRPGGSPRQNPAISNNGTGPI